MSLLVTGYLIQVVSPLRLHPDTVVLLSIADSVIHGHGFLSYYGQPTVFPPGYPALVALLQKFGIAHNGVLIGFNFLSTFVGLWAVSNVLMRRIFKSIFPVLNVCLVSASSFVFIKYGTIPLSDAGFFGLAMCSLAVMESLGELKVGQKFWLRMVASWFLAAAALAVRRVGLALIPALLWSFLSHTEVRQYLKELSRRTKVVIILVVGCVSGITYWIVSQTSTLRDRQTVMTGHSLFDTAYQIFNFRLKELGEMTFNLPYVALSPVVQKCVPAIGALLLVLVLVGIVLKRQVTPMLVFFGSYLAIIFVWPYYDLAFGCRSSRSLRRMRG
ncbi:MAG: hypothetical protein ACLP59_21765 [Bryobacteraceae bacterium]